jgi:hypothetical protein
VAFVGGSLVPVGGHNLLEPAALGVPILTGPHNFNSADVARLLIERGAAEVVRTPAELAARLTALFADPAARERIGATGRESGGGNRGALAKLRADRAVLAGAAAAALAAAARRAWPGSPAAGPGGGGGAAGSGNGRQHRSRAWSPRIIGALRSGLLTSISWARSRVPAASRSCNAHDVA